MVSPMGSASGSPTLTTHVHVHLLSATTPQTGHHRVRTKCYLQSAMSKNTVASYTSAHCRYLDFCHRSSHQAYPASENTVSLLASLQNLKHQQSNHTGTCQVCVTIILCNRLFPEPFINDMPWLQ